MTAVVPARDEERYLGRVLSSLLEDDANADALAEVIVVDDQSVDRTREIAAAWFSAGFPVRTVTGRGSGIGAARNEGAGHATTTCLLFVDADAVVLPGAVPRIEAFLRARGLAVATAPFLPDAEAGGWAAFYGPVNAWFFGLFSATRNPACPGFFVLCDRAAFDAANGFRVDLGYGEDHDLVRRIVQMGEHFGVDSTPGVRVSARRFRQPTLSGLGAALMPYLLDEVGRVWRHTLRPAIVRQRG